MQTAQTQQGHGACSDSQDLRWPSWQLCDSFYDNICKKPRSALHLTDRFWEMAPKIT